ncbi:MAG: protein-L-isoaspartate(D-aspartate) O-methyltransferase [Burkholderiaceae bacterium]|nr:protein-L-isoaspartate(D-aspartate) O-methyltransferase [Burkholderiaceae bacterium]
MTTKKTRQFPLPLSSVVDPSSKGRRAGIDRLTPQTASRNAAQHHQHNSPKPTLPSALRTRAPAATSAGTSVARPAMLVSNAVRRAMVDRLVAQGIRDEKVLAAMDAAPRHLFVEPALASQAYIDASLPIGHHQTISQPYIVARMIEILRDNRHGGKLDKVLEIGTGCGYQALVLSMVAKEVYSIERIKGLHELAKNRLRPLLVPNIRLHYGDGMLGLPQAAPFDGIILAAAGMEVPDALLKQLAVGGRLIAPVGGERQALALIERTGPSSWSRTALEECHFVPLRKGVT